MTQKKLHQYQDAISLAILFSPLWVISGLGIYVILKELYKFIFG